MIVLKIDDAVPAGSALDAARVVIDRGHVSTANDLPHFCWLTIFRIPDGSRREISVAASRRRSPESNHVLTVRFHEGS